MIEAIDAMREMLEPPDPAKPEFSMSGLAIDSSCAQPLDPAPWTVYAWEETSRQHSIGTGEVQEDFEFVIVATEPASEAADVERSRDVSVALDDRRETWLKLIRNGGPGRPWANGSLQAMVDADMLRQLGLRGLAVRVTGYRIVTGT